MSAAELDATGVANVGGDLLAVEIDAPAFKNLFEFLATVALLLQQLHLGAFRHRIDERQHLAALQGVLIDGVSRLRLELRRLRNHQHVDVRGDFLHVLINGANVEELADLTP